MVIGMGLIYAKNKKEAVNKTKSFIKNIFNESPIKFNIVVGNKHPRLNIDNNKSFYISITKKRKYII